MGEVIGYARVSTDDQTTENQKQAIEARYSVSRWFTEEAVSGASKAADRPAMAALINYVRDGDTVVVVAIDRLGRNTIDVLTTVEELKAKGVSVISMREGFDLSTSAGKLMLTMLAAVAELERENIKARQMAGIERARKEGKNLGREKVIDDVAVAQWRADNKASIKATAEHFGISTASVKRACRR
ncbi:recombinase family protein [Vibrio alginolyticus]|uniref:recombinase family protein n=1 Tax=Vibrio alginolyticus TaxID=663 RepID=UPI00215C1A43|nr:recombinase family protein [Vibrio alginolyticus]EKL9831180.1 recombinase family protein [Vibrio alginolyticus]MCR9489394.1 recombinase family protein [Vibrio alginolyticus]